MALCDGSTGARGWGGVRFPGSAGSRTSLGGPLLLPGRKWRVQLAVDEEVGQYSAWGPGNAIGPSLDARGGFLIHEDIPTDDQRVPLPIVRATRAVMEQAIKTCLEDEQSILGGLDVTAPGRNALWWPLGGAHIKRCRRRLGEAVKG